MKLLSRNISGKIDALERALLVTATELDPAAVNRLLVSNGVQVSELVLERSSLEELFLELTNSTNNSQAADV